VLRDDWVDVQYFTVDGKLLTKRLFGEASRCFQHEWGKEDMSMREHLDFSVISPQHLYYRPRSRNSCPGPCRPRGNGDGRNARLSHATCLW